MNREKKHFIYPHFLFPLKRIVARTWHALFPSRCVGCGMLRTSICENCLTKAQKILERDKIMAVFDYKNESIKQSLWKLKYHHTKSVAVAVAPFLFDTLLDLFSDEIHSPSEFKQSPLLLTPIPITKKRKRTRGYNQAEELARAVLSIGHHNFLSLRNDVLEKIRETKPQTKTKSRKERLANLRGCFAVAKPEAVYGKTLIVIDDITTTGATFLEAEKVLREAGAKRVICLAVAH